MMVVRRLILPSSFIKQFRQEIWYRQTDMCHLFHGKLMLTWIQREGTLRSLFACFYLEIFNTVINVSWSDLIKNAYSPNYLLWDIQLIFIRRRAYFVHSVMRVMYICVYNHDIVFSFSPTLITYFKVELWSILSANCYT